MFKCLERIIVSNLDNYGIFKEYNYYLLIDYSRYRSLRLVFVNVLQII